MNTLGKHQDEYTKNNYITFGIKLSDKFNKKESKYKKVVVPPKNWTKLKLNENKCEKGDSALGLLTGEVNGVFIIDIDNVEDWNKLLIHIFFH